MTEIICVLPPIANQHLNPALLGPSPGLKIYAEDKLIRLANKKIRSQDVGKRKEFDRLLIEYRKVYERKKIEEAEYKEAFEKAKKKRPCIPNTSKTAIFRRI